MVEQIIGFRAKGSYKLYDTEAEALAAEKDFNKHQKMYAVTKSIPYMPSTQEVAEWIIRNYPAIKAVMEENE